MIAYKYGLSIGALALHLYLEQIKNFERKTLVSVYRDGSLILLTLL
jgi:hypothetical protein